jgi:hypothetical protein
MPKDPTKKPLLPKEATSSRAILEEMHRTPTKTAESPTFTRQGAEEVLRRVRKIGYQFTDPPKENWREVFERVGVPRQRDITDYSLGKSKGLPAPEGLLKSLQRRAGGMFNFYMRKVAGPLGIVTDPYFQYGAQEKYEFDRRLALATVYATRNPELAMKNAGEIADFLFRGSDQDMYENQLYGVIEDHRELNRIDVLPEYIEALHQEELWTYLESPSLLSDHPNLQGPSSVLDFKTQLPRLYFHGQKGGKAIRQFEQQRDPKWSLSPQPEFGAAFFGSAGQVLDITARFRQAGDESEEGFVLPDPEGVEREIQMLELKRKQGATSTTGTRMGRQGTSALGFMPFAGVVDGKQVPPKYYAGVLDVKNPMIVRGDIGYWTVWNILGFMSGAKNMYNEPGDDTNPLSINILAAGPKERPNYLGNFTYWPEENYFEESWEAGNWNIPQDVRDSAYVGSGTAFQRVMEYAEKRANQELDANGNPKTLKWNFTADTARDDWDVPLTEEEEIEMYFDDSEGLTNYTDSETYSDYSGLSDEEKDAVADEILLGTPDEYENDFNYFVNLGFRDFLLKDLGIDGIQFFNAIEDKLKSDWSYIILDGSQFKNIKQRKKAGEGFDKSKRPHMSKYQKTSKYRKVS